MDITRQASAHRFSTPILLVCAAIGVACGSERVFEPERAPVFTALDITPAAADLFADTPWDSVQLSIAARDQTGAPMPGAGAPIYYSSAPAIASVSSSGVVSAAGPGTAVIAAKLTLGGITKIAFMTAMVYGPNDEYPPNRRCI
jgi:hypothetical protein